MKLIVDPETRFIWRHQAKRSKMNSIVKKGSVPQEERFLKKKKKKKRESKAHLYCLGEHSTVCDMLRLMMNGVQRPLNRPKLHVGIWSLKFEF